MPKRNVKRKRSKAIVLLILPALIFIGFVGWLISSLEPSGRKATKGYHAPKSRRQDDGVTFMPAVYEETTEVETI